MLCMRPRDVDGSESQATSCDQGGPDAHGEVWNTIPILKAGFMKRLRLLALLLALTVSASAVDQKSLLLGVGIGLGVYATQHGIVPAITTIAVNTKRATRKTTRGMKRAIVGSKKKADCPKGK